MTSFVRREVDDLVVKYAFDLRTNTLSTERIRNPHAGRQHPFRALRLVDDPDTPVILREGIAENDTDEEE